MTELDFETAQLQLLTDALRAGPGTPEWRAALASVEHLGAAGADEYKLLYAARERLASGRRYREVRAGPAFTRKLIATIDEQENARARVWPSANIIAAASALVILGVIAIVAYLIVPGSTGTNVAGDLSDTYFTDTLSANEFEEDLGMQWAAFGPLPVEARGGLRPMLKDQTDEFRGGGAFYERAVPANQPFAVEATIMLSRATDDLAIGVFVTDDPNFTGDSATSEHELVCLARGRKVSVVLPQAHLEGQSLDIGDGRMSLNVRIAMNQNDGVVEVNGNKLWSGKHQLSSSKERLIGVRFLSRFSDKNDGKLQLPVVSSMRILTPQKR